MKSWPSLKVGPKSNWRPRPPVLKFSENSSRCEEVPVHARSPALGRLPQPGAWSPSGHARIARYAVMKFDSHPGAWVWTKTVCGGCARRQCRVSHLTALRRAWSERRACSAGAALGHDPEIIHDPRRRAFDGIDAGDLPLGVMDDTASDEVSYPLSGG
jgi:hypothetical protein